jgi:2-methylcitrate dehydratase PrpD
MRSVAHPLAAWAAALRWEPLPDAIQDDVRTIVLDTIGCLLLGSDHPETIALRSFFGERPSPAERVLVDGVATGVDVFDGGNIASRGHVAGYVLPAVLTAAELRDPSPTSDDILAAFFAGYEIAARIGIGGPLRAPLHPSGTWGVVGAAAAIGSLRRYDAATLAALMEFAANLTLATSWDAATHGATVRDLYSAMPSYLGTLAADLFAAGFRGGPRSIEITFGEISSTSFDPARCLEGLGETYAVRYNYSKRYAGCRNFQAVVDGAVAALPKLTRPFDPAADSVRVGTDAIAIRDNLGVHFENALGARESLPVSIAMVLLHGRLTPQMYRDARVFQNDAVVNLARRIEIVEEVPRPSPDARPGWIEITQSGTAVREHVDHPAGNPGNPLARAELEEKFVANASGVLGGEAVAIRDRILRGDLSVMTRYGALAAARASATVSRR